MAYEWETVTLDGSGSNDPKGTIIDYEWDLDNDGSFDDATGVNPSVPATIWGEGTHTVSLRVVDNEQLSDTASTTITINPIPLSKDAVTSFTRTHSWDITKDVNPEEVSIPEGGTGTVDFTVTVNHQVYDSGWAVSGYITIDNPSSTVLTITGVSDVLSGSIAVTLPVTLPYVIPAGDTLSFGYSVNLPDGTDRVNTVMVTAETSMGASIGAQAAVTVTFGAPTDIVGYSEVHVTDTNGQSWVTSDSASWTYSETYILTDIGVNTNTVTITETSQSDDASVLVVRGSPVFVVPEAPRGTSVILGAMVMAFLITTRKLSFSTILSFT